MKTTTQDLERIKDLFLLYKAQIELSEMKPLTKKIYITHAENFVRWASGEFVPGERLKMRQTAQIDNQGNN